MTSARSAGAAIRLGRHRAVEQAAVGADLDGGRAALDRRFQNRALDALRMRKRYFRGSTSRNGCAAPLTSGVSPKNSGIHVEVGRVEQLARAVEEPVGENERDLVGAARHAEAVGLGAGVERVADDVRPDEPRVDVEPRDLVGVVVVPEHRRVLVVGIDDALDLARPVLRRVRVRVAVAGPRDVPPCRCVFIRTGVPGVHVVGDLAVEQVLRRQRVDEADLRRRVLLDLDRVARAAPRRGRCCRRSRKRASGRTRDASAPTRPAR